MCVWYHHLLRRHHHCQHNHFDRYQPIILCDTDSNQFHWQSNVWNLLFLLCSLCWRARARARACMYAHARAKTAPLCILYEKKDEPPPPKKNNKTILKKKKNNPAQFSLRAAVCNVPRWFASQVMTFISWITSFSYRGRERGRDSLNTN